MPRKKKQAMTTFEGGEGATAQATVKPKVERKPDPAFVEMKKRRKDKRDKRTLRANDNISWEGYKK